MPTRSIFIALFLLVVLFPTICLGIEITDAVICTDVQKRQPVGQAISFPTNVGKVFCWSRIKDGQATTIKHIYYRNGQEIAVVQLPVTSPLFRTFSSKRIMQSATGQWRVDIVDSAGNVMKSLDFTIGEPAMRVEPIPAAESVPAPEPTQSTESAPAVEPVPAAQTNPTEEGSGIQ